MSTIYAVAASSDALDFQSIESGSQPTPPLQLTDEYGVIRDSQMAMFGDSRIVGSYRAPLTVREIPRHVANDVIRRNHYSHSVYLACSRIHLGVFWNGDLVGALQYGYALNPHSQGSVVEGTDVDEYLELNRMWLSDSMPRNAESAALSQSIRYIKAAHPKIAWIQSFADERCGGLGVVYQAASFLYCGQHTATFWELDGEWFHKMLVEARTNENYNRSSPKGMHLRRNIERAVPHSLRQFRYIKFLKRGWNGRLLFPALPYPKRAAAA